MSKKKHNKGVHKGGEINRFELSGMALLKSKPGYEEIFKKARCLKFYHKLDGHHVDISYRFVLGYDGKASKIGGLVIPTTTRDISLVTGIPEEGEKWFKSTSLDLDGCRKFFSEGYQNIKMSAGALRCCITKENDDILKVIQRYLTCEGRFNMVYAYHIRLPMHFKGLKTLNLPYFLHQSLGKMKDKI